MTAFPAITPNERNYDLGQVPVAEYRGEGNVAIVFRTGSIRVGQRLQLLYRNRLKAEIKQLYDHQQGQQLATFTLPSEVWCGHSAGATIASSELVWRYVDQAEPQRINADRFSLTITLEAVGVSIPGTAADWLDYGQTGELVAVGNTALPSRPVPVPDPPILPAVITEVPNPAATLPPCRIFVGAAAELRWGSAGLLDPATVSIGGAAELRWGSHGLLEPARIEIGGTADLSEDP
jgi:hypothetical protein